MSTSNTESRQYVLGHSKHELERLAKQAEYYRPSTRNMLISAGISKGMRVLDFGAGAGDVSLLLSELVGETGEVIAVDRSSDALARARDRLSALEIHNVRLVAGDETTLAELFREKKADAAVGRLVLLHQRDAIAVFCKVAEVVRPGGIIAFQEIDIDGGIWAQPPLPLMSQVFEWITKTFMAGGMPHDISARLIQAFDTVGIRSRHIGREGIVESGPEAMGYDYYADVVRTLLPVMEKLKVASPAEVQLETLSSRLREEAVSRHATFIPVYMTGAYGVMPG